MELGRIIVLVGGERHSLIRVSWLTKIFVSGDVLSFLMQASGKFHKHPPLVANGEARDLTKLEQ